MKIRKMFLFLLPVLLLHSCTLITDPERVYNDKAHPPEIFTYNFDDIPSGKHIDGTNILYFNPDEIYSKLKKVSIYIDDENIDNQYELPCHIYLPTRQYPDGAHKISVYLFLEDSHSGLLNIIGAPSKVYETTLIFDHTPPDNVNMSQPVLNTNGLELSWSESVNENFFAYIFYKSVSDQDFIPCDTIYNKAATTYIDTSFADLEGIKSQYKVIVTTDPMFSICASSDTAVYLSGRTLNYNFSSFQAGPFCSETNSRLYFIADNKLLCFSTIDEGFINSTDISGLFDQEHDPVVCNFNNNESRIYLYNMFNNVLCIVNSFNLDIIKTFNPYEGDADMFIPDDNRIIINDCPGLKLIDIETNTLLDFLPFANSGLYTAALNENHTKLIRQHDRNRFYIIDLTDNDLNIIDSVDLNTIFYQLKSSGSLLCGDGTTLYNSNTYELIGYLAPERINFSVSADRVLTVEPYSYSIPGFSDIQSFEISMYNSDAQHLKDKYFICDYNYPQPVAFHNKVYVSDPNTPEQNILCYVINFGD